MVYKDKVKPSMYHKEKIKVYDAFETKEQAENSKKDLESSGYYNVHVVKFKVPQDSGRLKYGVYTSDKRLI